MDFQGSPFTLDIEIERVFLHVGETAANERYVIFQKKVNFIRAVLEA
jgi:hypothetical protein